MLVKRERKLKLFDLRSRLIYALAGATHGVLCGS